jgi:hypothetical protein
MMPKPELNQRHKAGLFLTLVAVGILQVAGLSLHATFGAILLGLAFSLALGSNKRMVHVLFVICGLLLMAKPAVSVWKAHRERVSIQAAADPFAAYGGHAIDQQQDQQIKGLPAGAIVRPVEEPIQGLPPGAIVRPIRQAGKTVSGGPASTGVGGSSGDWFAQNAPKPAPKTPAAQDWFAAHAPKPAPKTPAAQDWFAAHAPKPEGQPPAPGPASTGVGGSSTDPNAELDQTVIPDDEVYDIGENTAAQVRTETWLVGGGGLLLFGIGTGLLFGVKPRSTGCPAPPPEN